MGVGSQGLIVKAQIKKNARAEIKLTGRCMDPLLRAGDTAEVVAVEEYCIGDMCLFSLSNGDLVVHRLVDENNGLLIMKGDRTRKYESISRKDIIGKVTSITPNTKDNQCDISLGKVGRLIVPWASRQSMLNKLTNPYRKLLCRICIRLNVLYGSSKRWLMENNKYQ